MALTSPSTSPLAITKPHPLSLITRATSQSRGPTKIVGLEAAKIP